MSDFDIYEDEIYPITALDNSMSPKIKHGDIVYCHPSETIAHGNIVFYSINGKSGIKRLEIKEDNTINLVPLNLGYETTTILYDERCNLIMSKVVGKINKNF